MRLYLFIWTPITATLRSVSISWCPARPSGIDAPRTSAWTAPASLRFPPSRLKFAPPAFASNPFISSPFFSFASFGETNHWTNHWFGKHDPAFASCLHNSCFILPIDLAPSLLPSVPSPWWLPVYLSVSQSGEAAAASVNKCLIFPLLVPVCLSVCLTCRQLSRRSGVAVSHVLVSLLLSVHLPVRDSQIRRVNLPPGFPVSQGEL